MSDSTGIAGLDQLALWSVALTAIAGAAALLWRVTRGAHRILQRLDEFADDWHGVPARPGVPGHDGVMARLGGIEQRLVAVEHELHPNSGGSLRDAVDRVAAKVGVSSPEE
ncbi:hypothetical protein ABH930_000344 [Kitasatospora sp. GAS204A]|uniref:hypothetical protein n=1 Tax=unclassified Kitasatospora TaxID=2633591 RepID=UPI0024737792|nr:hypothetical protein [Kitasatospora sp. GAS204B]MDH6116925.1 hypothetical protein [Kitasatospora sp. GAS204B]